MSERRRAVQRSAGGGPVALDEATRLSHESCSVVYGVCVERVNVTLEDEHAAKLLRVAERMHVPPGTIARSLLAQALDEADPDPRIVVELLDGIAGAHDRAQLGLRQASAGQSVSLDEL